MRKLINHIKRWNKWRRYNCNSKLHKFLVLIGLIHSPTFVFVLTDEELLEIQSALDNLKGEK